jgi:2-oxoglutarate ferredoxin oxidoreductase subunit beta
MMFYEKNKDIKKSFKNIVKKGSLDYRSREMPIWCPGCGDFAIAQALIEALNELKIPQHNIAIASGIGCSGRFPVFMKSYGFHGVHGRALPLATGMKLGNESLTVFAVGGDGDGLSIGAGHFPHAARRNIDITYLLFDNSIYALTKGQTSPTADTGTVSKTTPFGSEESPLNPVLLALSYGASFVGRAFSGYQHEMKEVIKKAILHKGFSLVHLLTPCIVFNKEKTYELYYNKCKPFEKKYKADNVEKAMQRAIQDKVIYTGVFFQKQRNVFGSSSRVKK